MNNFVGAINQRMNEIMHKLMEIQAEAGRAGAEIIKSAIADKLGQQGGDTEHE